MQVTKARNVRLSFGLVQHLAEKESKGPSYEKKKRCEVVGLRKTGRRQRRNLADRGCSDRHLQRGPVGADPAARGAWYRYMATTLVVLLAAMPRYGGLSGTNCPVRWCSRGQF